MSKRSKMLKLKKAEYDKALDELSLVRTELNNARRRFDYLTDADQMDVCILEISALSSKYNCALRNIKTLFF